jgi:hypothetical protein
LGARHEVIQNKYKFKNNSFGSLGSQAGLLTTQAKKLAQLIDKYKQAKPSY